MARQRHATARGTHNRLRPERLAAHADQSRIVNAVAGRIVAFNDYQISGRPVMGVRIELADGNAIWADTPAMLHAIARAVKRTGARDLEVGGNIGMAGSGGVYGAVYERPESA